MKRRGGYRWTDPSTSRDSAHSVDASAREYDVLRMLSGYPAQPLNGWRCPTSCSGRPLPWCLGWLRCAARA